MADRPYINTVGTQNHSAVLFYKGFDRIAQMEYAGEGEDMIGESLFGADDLGTEGLHNEVLFRTGLQGQAALMPDRVRQRFPQASYRMGSIMIHGYRQIGISHEYYPEELEDNLPGFDWLANLASDLPLLMRDAEEDLHMSFYNNGEAATQLVGHANTPLFVDGSSYTLKLLGRDDYFTGTAASNIIENGGGVSHSMLALARQYGDHFVNEEGRAQRKRIVKIVGRRQNIELIRQWIGANANVETFNPNSANPSSDLAGVELVATERMTQPNDLIFFYDGWQDHIKMRAKYQNRTDTFEEGHAQFRKVYTQVRSRLGYYAYNNRLVLLMRGAA